MTEDELRAAVDAEVANSLGYHSGALAEQRKMALQYYYGMPFGNEVVGQSQVVSTDVADTIESALPQIVKIFTSAEEIVRFDPQGPEDEEAARQATDYLNYLFFRQNKGFVVTYGAIKDGLLSKNAFAKVYWDTYEDYETETYENLSDDEIAFIAQDLGAMEVLSHSQSQVLNPLTGQMQNMHALRLRKKKTVGKVCVDLVPPEEVLVSRGATQDIQKCRFVAHRCKKTVSELRLMGFEVDDVTSDYDGDFNEERQARFEIDEEDSVPSEASARDDPTREVWITEAYIRVDYDEDGIAELRKVTLAGNKVLDNEEADRIPFVTGTPIMMPHKLIGVSMADLVMDLQFIKSTVWRQILDNMYLTNNSRVEVLDGMVNIDDLLTVRPGGVVRVKTFNAIKPMQVPVLGAPAFQLLEYVDTVRELRTGVTRYNQGLDTDSLNKTASGVNRIFDASMERILLIARIFAETFFADLFWAMLELVSKHETEEKIVRLRGKWVPVDPRGWKNKFDMTIAVGLGSGSQQDLLAGQQGIMNVQKELVAGGRHWVTEQNLYNSVMDFARLVNPKKAESYFTDPAQLPPPRPTPDPKIVTTQMKIQAQEKQRAAKMAQDREMEYTRLGADVLKSMADKEHDAAMAELEHENEMDRAAADFEAETLRNGHDEAKEE